MTLRPNTKRYLWLRGLNYSVRDATAPAAEALRLRVTDQDTRYSLCDSATYGSKLSNVNVGSRKSCMNASARAILSEDFAFRQIF